MPLLPSTPENSQFYSKKSILVQDSVTVRKRATISNKISLAFLKDPSLLGTKGGQLLLQLINDEKQNVRASNAEIAELNKIIHKRLKLRQSKQNGWENEIVKFALDKVLLKPTQLTTNLINSYFGDHQKN